MSSSIKSFRYCKVAGHQSKKIIKICVSKQQCTNRYLCELCLKSQNLQHIDQCISIDQFLQRINQIKMNYIASNKIDELSLIFKNKINSCFQMIQQQFSHLEDKVEIIQTNIRNNYTNITQILDQLSSNPLGFNDENLNRNLCYLQDEVWNEFQQNVNKGTNTIKKYFNILHEQSLKFKLISTHSKQGSTAQLLQTSETIWHLKGIDQQFESEISNHPELSRFILYYSAQTQELIPHIKGGGLYHNGMKISEWKEIVRENPFQYHYITNYFNNNAELLNTVDLNYCDLSSDALNILEEYEQPKFSSNQNSIVKDLSSRVFLSPKALSIDRVRLGSYTSVGKSSRKLEKYF